MYPDKGCTSGARDYTSGSQLHTKNSETNVSDSPQITFFFPVNHELNVQDGNFMICTVLVAKDEEDMFVGFDVF